MRGLGFCQIPSQYTDKRGGGQIKNTKDSMNFLHEVETKLFSLLHAQLFIVM